MFDWLFGNNREVESVRESFWSGDFDSAKDRYDSIRNADWADPDQWEMNLLREDARED